MKEIALDILPDGTIRFTRGDEQSNKLLLELIAELAPTKKEEVKKFLDGAKKIELLIGSESLCG